MAVLLVLALLVLAPLAPRALVSRPMLRPVSRPRLRACPRLRAPLWAPLWAPLQLVGAGEIFRPSSEIRVISRRALTDSCTKNAPQAAGAGEHRISYITLRYCITRWAGCPKSLTELTKFG